MFGSKKYMDILEINMLQFQLAYYLYCNLLYLKYLVFMFRKFKN